MSDPLWEVPAVLQFHAYMRRPALPGKVEDARTWDDDAIAEWDKKAAEVDAHNDVTRRHNRRCEEEWLKVLEDQGVTVYGKRGGILAPVRAIIKDMKEAARCNFSLDPCVRSLSYVRNWPLPGGPGELFNIRAKTLADYVAEVRKRWVAKERSTALKDKLDKHWLAEAHRLKIDTSKYASMREYLDAAREASLEEYVASRDGEVVDFDQCDSCDEWEVGEHRCSCGNRRVYLECEFDAHSMTWYGWPAPH